MTSLLVFALLTSGTLSLGQQARSNANTFITNGCLQYDARGYRLLDDSGESVALRYHANKLRHFIGQQVAITGIAGTETISTTVDGSASSVDEVPVLEVLEVKAASGACTPSRTQ